MLRCYYVGIVLCESGIEVLSIRGFCVERLGPLMKLYNGGDKVAFVKKNDL